MADNLALAYIGGGYGGRYLAGIIYIVICCALIGAGFKAIMGARQHSSWDPSVAKMSIGSGTLGILLGIGMLWFGFTQMRMFGLFPGV